MGDDWEKGKTEHIGRTTQYVQGNQQKSLIGKIAHPIHNLNSKCK